MLRIGSRALLFGVLAVLAAATPARGSVLIGLDLDELTAQADRIVLGRVVWAEPIRHQNGHIHTRFRVQVERDLRGSGDQEIIVQTLGGRIGELAMRVEGAPSLQVGDRAVVFVEDDGHAVFRPVGMAQGVMHVHRESGREMVAPDSRGMLLLRRDASGRLVRTAGPLPRKEQLDTFLSRVRDIVARERGVAR